MSVGLTAEENTATRERATSCRSFLFVRAGQLATTVTLTIAIAGGCGSVNGAGGDADAGTSGQSGHAGNGAGGATGSAGASGAAGSGTAGTTGTGGGSTGSAGSIAGAGGHGGSGGNAGSGRGGSVGVAGTGGSTATGGRGGAGGGINCVNGAPCPGFCIPGQVYCNGICVIQCQGGGGTTGTGGAGGAAGRGGSGAGGNAGASGAGGTGGSTGSGGAGGTTSPCQAVLALDRSCTTATDCFAGTHTSSCCGQLQFIGFNNSAKTQFQTLEAACDATYPACGCAAQQPTADDGSRLRFNEQAGVTCLQGKCTTFVPDCGKPCGTGTTCFSCSNHNQVFAACTTMCADSAACTDPTLPMCQMGASGNTAGKFCTAANVACDTK